VSGGGFGKAVSRSSEMVVAMLTGRDDRLLALALVPSSLMLMLASVYHEPR
jgi:hypothetical protein